MLLASRGRTGVDIAIANVLGSKILNNSLLLGIMVLAAPLSKGLEVHIPSEALLSFQVYWASVPILLAMLLADKRLTREKESSWCSCTWR